MTPRVAAFLSAAAVCATAVGLLAAAPAAPAPPALAWPVACRLGVDCQIQNYVDRDPSPAVVDYQCGARSYEGHDGVDIRLPGTAAMRRGVDVLAAADGRVQGIRDGMADVSVDAGGPASVRDKECGNGVIVTHAGGLVTQYCHLAQGSVKVKAGDVVKTGDALGRVGMSGLSDFPHLHLGVRLNEKAVDPFSYGAAPGQCRAGRSLWRETPAYQARAVLNAGFSSQTLTLESAEAGPEPARADGAVLIAYVRLLGIKQGDVQTLEVRGPGGTMVARNQAAAATRDQPLRLLFTGARKPAAGWPKGRYTARYTVSASGKTVLTRDFALSL